MAKQTEKTLQDANQCIGQVINCAQEGIIVYDLELRYRVWNPFMEEMTGLAACEVLGRHPAELFPFMKDLGLITRLEKALSGENMPAIDYPYTVLKSGKSGWTSNKSSALRSTTGEIIGVIATVREISWRKRIEDELRQTLANAEAGNVTMTRLLRSVAHEFRNPLGVLIGSTDILDRYWDRLTPEKRFEQNEHIRSASRQLTNLVSSVVEFNRLKTDKSGSIPVALDVGAVCAAITAEVRTATGAGQECTITVAADCGYPLLDETLLRRILQNLLTNAFLYTPADGAVAVYARREKNWLLMEITDNGIGIPADEQALVFDAFYRGKNVEGRGGLGLGLSIVRDSLAQMGGTVTVSSSFAKGTTMRVEIPVIDPPQN